MAPNQEHGWWLRGDGLFIGRTPGKRKPRLYHTYGGKVHELATFESEEDAAMARNLLDLLVHFGGRTRPPAENLQASDLSDEQLHDLDRQVGFSE